MSKKRTNYIYAYQYNVQEWRNMIKVGDTRRSLEERLNDDKTLIPMGSAIRHLIPNEADFERGIEGIEAVRNDGSPFRDHDVHAVLRNSGRYSTAAVEKAKNNGITTRQVGREWYYCTLEDVNAAIEAVKEGRDCISGRTNDFKPRWEQQQAIEKTKAYFEQHVGCYECPQRFLWNCKMRFGKTFTSYKLAQAMGWKRLLVLTFKPAVKNSWAVDLNTHRDFEGWSFIYQDDIGERLTANNENCVVFCSFQYMLSLAKKKGKKEIDLLASVEWDAVYLDEYHFGSWRERAQNLFGTTDLSVLTTDDQGTASVKQTLLEEKRLSDECDEAILDQNAENQISNLKIKTRHFLYLSGTPMRALRSGEFTEEQIYNWTYADEQARKSQLLQGHSDEYRFYEWLPQMEMHIFDIGKKAVEKINSTGNKKFDLNAFFECEKIDGEWSVEKCKFKNEEDVNKFIHRLYENYDDEEIQNTNRVNFPFTDELQLDHTVWFMPDVASCYAMKKLLKKSNFFGQYEVNACAGEMAGIGVEAEIRGHIFIDDALWNNKKTITLTCGKLLTGVTIKPWSAILMLCNCKSPETYFQAAFRVQNAWKKGNKRKCYIYDFAPNRAFQQIMDFCHVNNDQLGRSPSEMITDFVKFMPVLDYRGNELVPIDSEYILEQIYGQITATTVVEKFKRPDLFNFNDFCLKRLQSVLNNPEFATLKSEMESMNHSQECKPTNKGLPSVESATNTLVERPDRKRVSENSNSAKTQKDKEDRAIEVLRSKMRHITERMRIYMYLTDNIEQSINDILPDGSQSEIENEHKALFKQTVDMDLMNFKLLYDLGLVKQSLLAECIDYFRAVEQRSQSLTYTGIDKHHS